MREAIINKSDEVMAESEQTVQNIWFDQWQNLMGYAVTHFWNFTAFQVVLREKYISYSNSEKKFYMCQK